MLDRVGRQFAILSRVEWISLWRSQLRKDLEVKNIHANTFQAEEISSTTVWGGSHWHICKQQWGCWCACHRQNKGENSKSWGQRSKRGIQSVGYRSHRNLQVTVRTRFFLFCVKWGTTLSFEQRNNMTWFSFWNRTMLENFFEGKYFMFNTSCSLPWNLKHLYTNIKQYS